MDHQLVGRDPEALMDITIEAAWVGGMLLALVRVTAFIMSSPIYAKAMPVLGRMAMAIVLGFFFAEPVAIVNDVGALLAAVVMNLVLGVALGFLTGLIFNVFTIAGGLVDFTSTLSSASIFDPNLGYQGAVFQRLFSVGAVALFFAIGGDRLIVQGIGTSFLAVGPAGTLNISTGLGQFAVDLVGRMMVAAVELAMPAIATLFVVELVLGLAARFAPQANIFLIGLPTKILAALSSVGAVALLMPETVDGVYGIIRDTFRDVIGGMSSF